MTELKTLKEIEYEEGCLYSEHVLKQEAIKWIKELEFKSKQMSMYLGEQEEINSSTYIINYIKHFFNITEEELK